MKTCSKCGESKPLEAYNKRKSATNGLQSQCRQCQIAWNTANKERKNDLDKVWRADNKEGTKQYDVLYRELNRDIVRKKKSVWRRENPHKVAASTARYRTRRSDNGVRLVYYTEIAAIAAMPCTACGAAGPSEVDHIIPLARGGSHSIGNLMPLCKSCNASKNDLLYIEWKYSARPQALKAFAA